jgi:hypothetical protein
MLVNGDDILFWCPDLVSYETWKSQVTLAGLSPSLGKNYISYNQAKRGARQPLVINSELFFVKCSRTEQQLPGHYSLSVKPPLLNLRLATGREYDYSPEAQEQSIFGTHLHQRDAIRTRAFDLIKGYDRETQDHLMSLFIRTNYPMLKRFPEGMNWFIHPTCGGIGLPVTRKVTLSPEQRKIAGFMALDPDQVIARKISMGSVMPVYLDQALKAHRQRERTLSVVKLFEEVKICDLCPSECSSLSSGSDTSITSGSSRTSCLCEIEDFDDYVFEVDWAKAVEEQERREQIINKLEKGSIAPSGSDDQIASYGRGEVGDPSMIWLSLLSHYFEHGTITLSDKGDRFRETFFNRFEKAKLESRKHWAQPLSFRKCVMGVSGRVVYPIRPTMV